MTVFRFVFFTLVFSTLIFQENIVFAQGRVGVGASAIYNFQTESFGAGLRAEVIVTKRLSVVPQAMYFFPFNKVHEIFGGINLHYTAFRIRKFNFYAIAGGSANWWLNYSVSKYKKAKPFNVIAEVGAGVSYGYGKIRPFLEYRYNPVWLEGSVHLGLTYFPDWGGRKTICPAYM